jgi:isoquinoline 1-oxidoreductase subunit alpha
MKIDFNINGKPTHVDIDPNMPLLWVVRDELQLTATKFGCGKALCGACTLHIDGEAVRSCSLPAQYAAGKNITTLEGLSSAEKLHPIQQAWMELQVPQCGYCQPGFMMAAAAFLKDNPKPTEADIQEGISNICRCGTHSRIVKAIQRAAVLNG